MSYLIIISTHFIYLLLNRRMYIHNNKTIEKHEVIECFYILQSVTGSNNSSFPTFEHIWNV